MTIKSNSKVLLMILDGWGLYKKYPGNAIELAKKPFYDSLIKKYPHAVIETSGEAVGLPEGQMGTSEVNHLTIGAGRIAYQDLVRINKDAREGAFEKNSAFLAAFKHVKENNSVLHIKGLLSPGGVHSHQEHIVALVRAASNQGVKRVFLHMFTDGRDTLPRSAKEYVSFLETELQKIGVGKIASLSGRYYAMDRDHNWDRTDKAFSVLTEKGGKRFHSAIEALEASYAAGVNDEFLEPVKIEVESGEDGCVSSNDAVIFVNFRNDRPRQLTERFIEKGPRNVKFVTMTQYDPKYPVTVAFPLTKIDHTLGQTLSEHGIKQLRITETEKFAHLTFFTNCKQEEAYEGEDRIMLDSYSDIKTHDERPEMRAEDIARMIAGDIISESHSVIMTNICNGDMVGHTTKIDATIKAIEAVDKALSICVPVALEHGFTVLITADHGNAEEMIDEPSGELLSQHSTNPVPLIVASKKELSIVRTKGLLSDIAPTILTLLQLSIPKEMTGKSFV
jgi:2,3-bisphosphoglycerate-independent phosphoglycerate mutase